MKRLLQYVATFFLLAIPAFALIQGGSESALIEQLNAAAATFEEARDASLAAPDDADLKAAADAAEAARDEVIATARTTRDAGTEGNSGELGKAIFAASGDLTKDGSGEAMADNVTKMVTKAKDWLIDEGPGMALKAVLFLLILFVFKILAGIGSGIASKAMNASKLKVSDLLKKFFIGMIQKLIFFAGVLVALQFIGIDTAPILAGIGVVGFVIGFALQDTLSNFASGVMILLYRPYDVGDVISAAGETGSVKDMSLVSTTMATPDNQKLIIPNSAIWGGTIRNITAQDTRRVDMVVGVGYGDDLDKAQDSLKAIVEAHPLVLADPAPVIKVSNLGDSAVEIVVRPWSKTSDYWAVYWDLTKTIKQTFDKEGISFPFPQSDVHIVEMPEGK